MLCTIIIEKNSQHSFFRTELDPKPKWGSLCTRSTLGMQSGEEGAGACRYRMQGTAVAAGPSLHPQCSVQGRGREPGSRKPVDTGGSRREEGQETGSCVPTGWSSRWRKMKETSSGSGLRCL